VALFLFSLSLPCCTLQFFWLTLLCRYFFFVLTLLRP